MKPLRTLAAAFAACLFAVAALAADPSGTWKWSVSTPNGEIDTTLKLQLKDGKLTGSYSNSFGDSAISNGLVKDDAISFDVSREFNGGKFVLKYAGKISGDTIKGSISLPAQDGGEGQTLPWNAKRAPAS
ncbi:MAG TPA: hypothetical protein VHC86_15500 [Opitutaceae bacterium]|nr:hypothetical protein [Opitutaceae bacterium]